MLKFRKPPGCLADVVHQVISDLDLENTFRVEVDIPGGISMPAPPRPLTQLVTALVRQAAGQMRDGGELTFIGWESEEACELEIADTGREIGARSCETPPVLQLTGAELQWRNCPQGGAAVTICFTKRCSDRKVA